MGRPIGFYTENPLPPSGGDTSERVTQLEGRGWHVDTEGRVVAPDLPVQKDVMDLYKKQMVKGALDWAQNAVSDMASAWVNNEAKEWLGQWNKKQTDIQGAITQAGISGDFTGVGGTALEIYDKWEEDYKNKRGAANHALVADLFSKRRVEVMGHAATAQTTFAKATANSNLNLLKQDLALKVRENPSQIPFAIKALHDNHDRFVAGHNSVEEAQQDIESTAASMVNDAISRQALSDPATAHSLLEQVKESTDEQQYVALENKIKTSSKIKRNKGVAQLFETKSVSNIAALANHQGPKVLNNTIKRDAEIFEDKWDTAMAENRDALNEMTGGASKDEIYISIGYVPELYQRRLGLGMTKGTWEERLDAAQSVVRLDKEMPPLSKKIPLELVTMANQIVELSRLDSYKANVADIAARHDEWQRKPPKEKQEYTKELNKRLNTDIEEIIRDVMKADIPEPIAIDLGLDPRGKRPSPETLNDDISALIDGMSTNDAVRLKKELSERVVAYSIMGASYDAAISSSKRDLRKNWGLSIAAGTDPYAAYNPIEKVMGDLSYRIISNSIMHSLSEVKHLPGESIANKADIRLSFRATDPKNEAEAIYDVYRYDVLNDSWLPYLYLDDGVIGHVQLRTGQMRAQMQSEIGRAQIRKENQMLRLLTRGW